MLELLRLHTMVPDYKGNGCGPEGWKGYLIPDNLCGIDISEACDIHDYDYTFGGTEDDRQKANLNFLCNMVIIIRRDDTWYTSEYSALKGALQYYVAVEDSGSKYFNYKEEL